MARSKIFLSISYLFFFIIFSTKVLAQTAWDPQKTHLVIAGVLEWQTTEPDHFSKTHRKDQELYDTLLSLGVPKANAVILLDEQATAGAIKQSIRKTASAVPADGTFIFYFAGHGVQGKEGNVFITNYDIDLSHKKKTGVSVEEIGDLLAQTFSGSRILLFADHCFSGAFSRTVDKLKASGKPVLSLTSSLDSNISTENWTFTQTLIDGFRGDPLADHDGNGVISIAEAAREIDQAMRYRELQKSGFANFSVPDSLILAKVNGVAQKSTSAAYPLGSYVLVSQKTARVIGSEGDRLRVQFYNYSDKEDVLITQDQAMAFAFKQYAVGTAVQVMWKGKPYAAKILKLDGDYHYITYTDYDSSWDEWVLSDRIVSN